MLAHARTAGGPGPPLLLLHAFPLTSWMWHRLVPLLERTAITVDLPGLGGSPTPRAAPTMAHVADRLVEVLDHLDVERCVPFGVSTGGYAALELAARHPGRLAGLVLGSTTPRLVAPDDPAERRRVAAQVAATGSTAPVADSAVEGLGATAHREQPELRDALTHLVAEADAAGVAWLAGAIAAREDRVATLAAYDGPVQLVAGAEDVATPPSCAEQMRADRARAGRATRWDVLPATGHLTVLERPREVAALLSDAWPA